jgi:hypothetical protein
MKTIAIEDLVTIVCTEFVKQNKGEIQISKCKSKKEIPYLKMNFSKRRKISEKLIEKIMGEQ